MDAQNLALFESLITASMALTRSNMEISANEDPNHGWAMQQISSRQARIRLVIEYSPTPSVTCELIREEDGEGLGFLFQLSARCPNERH
jgi:hypothetical protein